MQLVVSADDLRPIVEAVVAELADRLGPADRLAYAEAEAAALMGIRGHVLRDCRLRGEISAKKIGKKYVYSRAALARYLGGGCR